MRTPTKRLNNELIILLEKQVEKPVLLNWKEICIINYIGDEVLRKKSKPVEKIDNRILTLIDDMVKTMYASKRLINRNVLVFPELLMK